MTQPSPEDQSHHESDHTLPVTVLIKLLLIVYAWQVRDSTSLDESLDDESLDENLELCRRHPRRMQMVDLLED